MDPEKVSTQQLYFLKTIHKDPVAVRSQEERNESKYEPKIDRKGGVKHGDDTGATTVTVAI